MVCLSNKQADRHIQMHAHMGHAHTLANTRASAQSEVDPPSRFASHSLVWPYNRDSYIKRIFSGPCLLQRGTTSLCHNTSHDHTSIEQREEQTNGFLVTFDSSIFFNANFCCYLCVCVVCTQVSDHALILMTAELWRQRCTL